MHACMVRGSTSYSNEAIVEVHAKEGGGDGGIGGEVLRHHRLDDGLRVRACGIVEADSKIGQREGKIKREKI